MLLKTALLLVKQINAHFIAFLTQVIDDIFIPDNKIVN